MVLDFVELKDFIDKSGLKQKAISERSGVPEVQLCLILQGKRKCEVGENASICDALGVKVDRFIKKETRMPDKKGASKVDEKESFEKMTERFTDNRDLFIRNETLRIHTLIQWE